MAKYKQPKNEKHKARKDLKDYTVCKIPNFKNIIYKLHLF